MSKQFSVGLFFKKPIGNVGSLSSKIPFLTKTLASLVYMSDGSTVETKIGTKVDKVTGKGLSTNDFTNEEKTKLNGLSNYVHPDSAAGAKSSGFYKVTTDKYGHVIAAAAVAKSDITGLGIPGSDTTYSTGNATTEGLTKLYTETGTNTDGTMTQNAINSALGGKANSGHSHTTSDISNFPSSLPASDVYSWAKAETKPTYSASEVGLGNVPNVTTNNQTPTYTTATTLAALTSGEKLSVAFGKLSKAVSDLISHLSNTSNPHSVTAAQTGAYTTTQIDSMLNGLRFNVVNGILQITYDE